MSGKPYLFCGVCKRSHNHGKSHKYGKRHQQMLEGRMVRERRRVNEIRPFLTKVMLVKHLHGMVDFDEVYWCHFCEKDLKATQPDDEAAYSSVFHHLASTPHYKATRKFGREMGAKAEEMDYFVLTEVDLRQYLQRVMKAEALHELKRVKEGDSATQPTRSDNAESSLGGVTSPAGGAQNLAECTTDMAECTTDMGIVSTHTPSELTPVTVTNKHGVKQNESGRDETGERVWGGGIVFSKRWYPWEADCLIDRIYSKAQLSAGSNTSVLGKAKAQRSTLQYTVGAVSDNLTCLPPTPLQQGEGNVYSNATPPWLKDTKEQTLPKKNKFDDLSRGAANRARRRKTNRPPKIGSDIDREAMKATDWLPDFGGVWNHGPRKETREKFQSGHAS